MATTFTMNRRLLDLLDDASEVASYLWQKGWAERNAGNISVDITNLLSPELIQDAPSPRQTLSTRYPALTDRCFLITGTGKRMRDLSKRPADNAAIIQILEQGQSYRFVRQDAFCCRPTSELSSHLGIHQMLRQNEAAQNVVLHTHPNELIALTHLPEMRDQVALNRLLWSMHPETKIVIPEGIGVVPYQVPGSDELGVATAASLSGRRVVVWEKHGAVAIGSDVFEALDLIDTLNKSAQIFLLCKSAGVTPEGLSPAQVAELGHIFHGEKG